jgi:hypothetical protein
LGSEFTVEFWIDAFTAFVDVETLAALLAESSFMFLTGPNRLPVRVISALHSFFFPTPSFLILFETGRGLSRT